MHKVELGRQLVLRLDLLQGLNARLGDLVVMPLVKAIRYDVELSCLHSAVRDLLCSTAPHSMLLCVIRSVTFVTLSDPPLKYLLPYLALSELHTCKTPLLAEASYLCDRVVSVIR